MRCLTNKRLRAALYYAADGKCQSCGCELPDVWHADHIVPFSVSHRTNVHEMQALCAQCNLKKGASMLRQHQSEMQKICSEIISGLDNKIREVLCEVTPGGGKSVLPIIAADAMIPRKADRICWVVPRLALQEQAERSFLDQYMRDLLGHQLEIRRSTNDINPSRGLAGYTTTYNAIGQDPALHEHEFSRFRYILVLDEPHHIEEDARWQTAIAPLIDKAVLVVYMSGTLERGNGKRIAFLPYITEQGGETISYAPTPTRAVIRYSYNAALHERAIVPAYFTHLDARAEWLDKDGQMCSVGSLSQSASRAREAVWTALNTDYAYQLLDKATQEWQTHRQLNPRSKFLVVAASIAKAADYVKHLRLRGIHAEIATSEDTEKATLSIAKFKKDSGLGAIDVLVTVAMAYEGLDVPAVTHLACLTHIRSRPWIEQMIARATRFDRQSKLPWEQQAAHIFTPDDPLMQMIIDRINNEQAPFIQGTSEVDRRFSKREEKERGSIAPIGSEATRERASELNGDAMDYDETAQIQKAMEQCHMVGVNPMQVKHLMVAMGVVVPSPSAPVPRSDKALIPMSQKEANIRKTIDQLCRQIDAVHYDAQWGETNRQVLRVYGKPRKEMTWDELVEVWQWLQVNYPEASV